MTVVLHPYLRPRPNGSKRDKKSTHMDQMSIKRALAMRDHIPVTLPKLKFLEGKEK